MKAGERAFVTPTAYDDNFNLESYDGALFTYDAQNRLLSASKGGTTVEFVYDGLGRCVKRNVNASATLFTYDDWKPTVEWDGSGNFQAWNVYGPGPDEILWRYQTGVGHLRYHHDRKGNVTSLLDWSGEIVEKYTYDAFGRPAVTDWWGNGHYDANGRYASWYGNRFMFQGREWIREMGLYDYRHRMYLPKLGRFLQTDPTGFDGGDMNLFRYCVDNPVNLTDPTGLYVATLTMFGGGLWSAREDGLTNLDVYRLNQDKIADEIRAFEKAMNEGGDRRVKWSGRVNEIHDKNYKFASDRTVATTDWTVNPTAISDGTVRDFIMNLKSIFTGMIPRMRARS